MARLLTTGLLTCAVAWPLATPAATEAPATPLSPGLPAAPAAPEPIQAQGPGQSTTIGGVAEFKQAIRRLYDLKEKAWAAGDAKAIVTLFYSADAVSAGEGDPETLVGRAQFLKAYEQYVKDVPTIRIESMRTYVNGNAGWDWANFYADVKPDKKSLYPPSPVRIVFLWARERGRWVCKGDMFVNGKLPPLP
jgi:uncharacterized protein (TIGR02246 family)